MEILYSDRTVQQSLEAVILRDDPVVLSRLPKVIVSFNQINKDEIQVVFSSSGPGLPPPHFNYMLDPSMPPPIKTGPDLLPVSDEIFEKAQRAIAIPFPQNFIFQFLVNCLQIHTELPPWSPHQKNIFP